jgi:hypothetical protein
MTPPQVLLNAVALTAGAVTDGNPVEVDFGAQGLTREFVFALKVVENSTAPGSARTITLNYYFSNDKIAAPLVGSTINTALSGRKTAATAVTRSTSASSTTNFSIVTTPVRPLARYMYVTLTKTTEDSGSIPTVTLTLQRVPSTVNGL